MTGLPTTSNSTTPPTVTISDVIRGNPYVARDAADAGLPASIPPGKPYEVRISITPPLDSGQRVDLTVDGFSSDNGSATLSANSITASGVVNIIGGSQTKPGFTGKIKLMAGYNGKLVAMSNGFSVCAHEDSMQRQFFRDVNDSHIGVMVALTKTSDSGSVNDLDQFLDSEKIEYGVENFPPFNEPYIRNTSDYMPDLPPPHQMETDTYSVGRPSDVQTAGVMQVFQAHIFHCLRCGARDKPIPRSGYYIEQKIFKAGKGGGWQHQTTCEGERTGFKLPDTGVRIHCSAGLGGAKSSIHFLNGVNGGKLGFAPSQIQGASRPAGPLGSHP